MPHLIGITSSGAPTVFNPGVPLYDPRLPRAQRAKFRRDVVPALRYANSFYAPSGLWPARGWFLVRRADWDTISKYTTRLAVQIDDFVHGPLTFQNLVIVQAQCVTTGVSGSTDAIYLVEVTDQRGRLYNPWFDLPTTRQYNVRAPAYPELFYESSMNAGVAWTWDGLVSSLWSTCGLPAYPGLPVVPGGTPEGWVFPGVCAWQALCRVLDYLGMNVSYLPTSSIAPYGIVQGGAADAAFAAQTAAFVGSLEDDKEWIDVGSGRVPGSITVLFHRRNQYYGTEETVRRDSLQWQSTPLYAVSVAAPAPFNAAAGTGFVWADFTVRYDTDNNPLAADVATAATVAAEQVTQYFQKIYRGTLGFMGRVYAGALPFVTGSQVDGVLWRQDFREGSRAGWRTEIVRGPDPPWPEVSWSGAGLYGG